MDIYRDLEARQVRRMHAEARFLDRIEAREIKALPMIGELCRDGQTVFYVWPQGGKYREGTKVDLLAFLLRNGYA